MTMKSFIEVLTVISMVGVEHLPTVTVCICLYLLVKQKGKSGNDKS